MSFVGNNQSLFYLPLHTCMHMKYYTRIIIILYLLCTEQWWDTHIITLMCMVNKCLFIFFKTHVRVVFDFQSDGNDW